MHPRLVKLSIKISYLISRIIKLTPVCPRSSPRVPLLLQAPLSWPDLVSLWWRRRRRCRPRSRRRAGRRGWTRGGATGRKRRSRYGQRPIDYVDHWNYYRAVWIGFDLPSWSILIYQHICLVTEGVGHYIEYKWIKKLWLRKLDLNKSYRRFDLFDSVSDPL